VQKLIRGTFAASVTHAGILSLASILNELGQFSKLFCLLAFASNFDLSSFISFIVTSLSRIVFCQLHRATIVFATIVFGGVHLPHLAHSLDSGDL